MNFCNTTDFIARICYKPRASNPGPFVSQNNFRNVADYFAERKDLTYDCTLFLVGHNFLCDESWIQEYTKLLLSSGRIFNTS